MTVDDFSAELDVPIPGFESIKAWMPKLNVGGDSSGPTMALQVSQSICIGMLLGLLLTIFSYVLTNRLLSKKKSQQGKDQGGN